MRRVIVFGALLLVGLAFAQSFGMMDRDHRVSRAWAWEGDIPSEGWLHIRNRNGNVRIERGTGDSVEIVASKSWTGRRPQEISFIANPVGNDLYVCAVYGGGGESRCNEQRYAPREISWFKRRVFRVREVNVAFTVRVPEDARVNVDTRDGRISVDAPLAALVATTRSGSIKAEEPIGRVEANSRSGSISAVLADGQLPGDIVMETRSGSVTLALPESINANVALATRSGRVTTEFPLHMEKLENTRNITGTLGSGGHTITLTTRSGSVRLKKRSSVQVSSDDVEQSIEAALEAVAASVEASVNAAVAASEAAKKH
jgi:DUF4097 and DUF4098 domain-containing protein YvlB